MRSKWWVGLSVLILAIFLATSAFAQLISWPRHWKVKFENWEWFNDDITPPYTSGPDGTEDNWGIAVITQIFDLDLSTSVAIWSDTLTDNKSLRIFFYGLDLAYWNSDNTYGMAALSSGAYLEIYEWDQDWDEDSVVNTANYDNVTKTFDGITDGGILLGKFQFTYGVSTDPNIVAKGTTDDLANPPNGTGQAFLKIVDGLYKDVWNVNRDELLATINLDDDADVTIDPDIIDPEADLFITFHFRPADVNGFNLKSYDPAYGATIPEPASLMLVGTGLLAIGMLVRRKKMF